MAPSVTVLQLDTDFPRIPGDVGCPETYTGEVEIVRISGASVGRVVQDRPEDIDIAPFEAALKRAKGDVVVTSCGFLSYWQTHLASLTSKPFISSALTALDELSETYMPEEVLIVTFDQKSLTYKHLGKRSDYKKSIVGLPDGCHLKGVIKHNRAVLDERLAGRELAKLILQHRRPTHKHVLLECTNLPPYKRYMREALNVPFTDILTLIDRTLPGSIKAAYL